MTLTSNIAHDKFFSKKHTQSGRKKVIMGNISKKVLETPASATVLIADRVKEIRRKGLTVFDFSAGRAVES
jgi:hypothetical protein